jgi:hypothetical protein
MFNWLRKVFGFESRRVQHVESLESIHAAERMPMSDIEVGATLLRRLEADSSLTEVGLAASLGRNVSYVRKVVAAARAAKSS